MDIIFHHDSSWEEVKEKIKEVNLEITDSDLDFSPGNEDELFDRLALKLHKTKQEIKYWIESISSNKTIAG